MPEPIAYYALQVYKPKHSTLTGGQDTRVSFACRSIEARPSFQTFESA